MQINEIVNILNKEFSPDSALTDDRIGLQVSSVSADVERILTVYELTDEVIDEATSKEIDLIIAFHPLIFFPLTNVNDEERVGRIIRKLIINDISLFVIHTNFDTHKFGTNAIIADKLNLLEREILVPSKQGLNNAIGIIGKLEKTISTSEFAETLSKIFNSPVKYCNGKSNDISKVAVLGGSGSSFLKNVMNSTADAYITADLSYHLFHQAMGRIALFDVGHYEMEQFNSSVMQNIISNLLKDSDITVINSEVNTNPVRYQNIPDNFKKNTTDFK